MALDGANIAWNHREQVGHSSSRSQVAPTTIANPNKERKKKERECRWRRRVDRGPITPKPVVKNGATGDRSIYCCCCCCCCCCRCRRRQAKEKQKKCPRRRQPWRLLTAGLSDGPVIKQQLQRWRHLMNPFLH